MKRSIPPTGFILKEAMMALALSLTLAVGVAQMLATVAQQRRSMKQVTAALGEAGNRMEELARRPWGETTPEHLASLGLSEEARQCLPGGKLHVEVADEDDDTRRISIRIDWRRPSGSRGEPVRLIAWKFRNGESRP